MKITVEIKNVYGEQKVYPVCYRAELFAAIAGTKTLTGPTIDRIKLMGYAVEVSQPTLEL